MVWTAEKVLLIIIDCGKALMEVTGQVRFLAPGCACRVRDWNAPHAEGSWTLRLTICIARGLRGCASIFSNFFRANSSISLCVKLGRQRTQDRCLRMSCRLPSSLSLSTLRLRKITCYATHSEAENLLPSVTIGLIQGHFGKSADYH